MVGNYKRKTKRSDDILCRASNVSRNVIASCIIVVLILRNTLLLHCRHNFSGEATMHNMSPTDSDVDNTEINSLNTSTPGTCNKDFDNILETIIRPFSKVLPRKGLRRDRRPGKTSTLTSDESMQEIDQNEKRRKAQKRKAFQPQTSNCSSNKMKKKQKKPNNQKAKQKHVSQIASASIRTRRNTAAAVDYREKDTDKK